jgi:hypothetical protein
VPKEIYWHVLGHGILMRVGEGYYKKRRFGGRTGGNRKGYGYLEGSCLLLASRIDSRREKTLIQRGGRGEEEKKGLSLLLLVI